MKVIDINTGNYFGLDLLNEANVVNIKDAFDGDSIAAYLDRYAENIGRADIKKMFTKKLSRLLMNDERFHHAVRQLPDDAPDWAKEALQKGELVYFKSHPTLDQTMEHMTHYLSAIEQALEGDNNDEKTVANRELQGFPKAESLDVLEKKSQEYFKRGSKKAASSEEGMTEIMDPGDNYKWFLLKTADAYRRAGKVLQNCIGSYWTREKAKKQGMEIVVLRGPQGFHVAARINNKDHTIEEMKGKNNRPPVDKYMAPVIKFVNKMKLGLARGAESDFKNAGYFYIDGKLYSRPAVIKKFVSKDEMGKTENGDTLVQINAGNSMIAEELFGDVYPEFRRHLGHHGGGDRVTIYEIRDKGTKRPRITGLVSGKTLEAFHRHSGGVEVEEDGVRESFSLFEKDESASKGAGAELVKELVKRKLIDDVSTKISKDMFWNDRVKLNTETGEYEAVKADRNFKTSDNAFDWEEHTNNDQVRQIKKALSSESSWNRTGIDEIDPSDVKAVFLANTERHRGYGNDRDRKPVSYVIIKTKNNALVPAVVSDGGDGVDTTNVSYEGSPYADVGTRHKGILQSTVELANDQKSDLTKSFRFQNGVVKDDGTYKVYEPKKQQVEGGVKIDLKELDPADRLAAMNAVIRSGPNRTREEFSDKSIHADDFELGKRVSAFIKGEKFKKRGYYSDRHMDDTSDWNGREEAEALKHIFGGKEPTAMYLVNLNYGADKKHEAALIADDKRVILVDTSTSGHAYQKWDDYDKVADQLNKFAKGQGLVFDRSSVGKEKELRVWRGEVKSASGVQKARLGDLESQGRAGLEGADEVPFEDGYKLVRMTPDEQADWARKGLLSDVQTGQGWKLLNADGKPEAVATVKDNKLQSVFTKGGNRRYMDDDTPEDELIRGIAQKRTTRRTMKYINQAMAQFGWDVKPTAQFVIKPESKQHKILQRLDRDPGYRSNVLGRVMSVVPGWSQPHAPDRHMSELGIINADTSGRGRNRVYLSIAPLGKRLLRQLNAGQSINTTGIHGQADIQQGWTKPEPKKAPKRTTTGGGQRGTITGRTKPGSKAEQALNTFTTFVDDNDRIPTRSEFMRTLMADPFNMSKHGAQTYYYTTKAKYAKLNEAFSDQALKELILELDELKKKSRADYIMLSSLL